MINVCLWQANQIRKGGIELLNEWQVDINARIWLDIQASSPEHDRGLLAQLGCHELAIEDALRTRHPPKLEHFEEQCFILYKGFAQCDEELDVEMLQIAFFISARMLISFRHGISMGISRCWNHAQLNNWLETPSQVLSRILNESGRVYLETLLETEKDLGEMEEAMLRAPDDKLMQRLINYKTRLRKLLRVFTYHERLISEILSDATSHIPMDKADNRHNYQDVADKFERLRSLSSLYYDLCGDLIEGYISLSSHRLNRTMQVLTVITAVFIPLGLMAGIYGMNFDHMPELHSPNGYYYLLGAMGLTAASLLWLFRRKKWI